MNWEYEVEQFVWESSTGFAQDVVGAKQTLQGVLSRLGQHGWELVSFVPVGDNGGLAILKRRLAADD